MIVAGASAYPRVIDFERIGQIAKKVNALFMVDMAHIAGLVAGGAHPSPVPYADVVTTTTHKTLRGPRGGLILAKAEYGPAINKAVFPGMQGGPLEHVIAGKAVCLREALQPEFKEYAAQIVKNAKALAAGLTKRGVDLVSGGTDNHLMLLDPGEACTSPARSCPAVWIEVYITANKNAIPNDPEKPFVTSGVRLGDGSRYHPRPEGRGYGCHRRVHLPGSHRLEAKKRRRDPCEGNEDLREVSAVRIIDYRF